MCTPRTLRSLAVRPAYTETYLLRGDNGEIHFAPLPSTDDAGPTPRFASISSSLIKNFILFRVSILELEDPLWIVWIHAAKLRHDRRCLVSEGAEHQDFAL